MDSPPPPTTTTTSSGDDDADHGGGPKDPTTIVKGKRTKRQRPTTINNVTHSSNSSPTSSSDSPAGGATAEDQDTANCLILLSKGIDVFSSIQTSMDSGKFNSKRYIQTSMDSGNGLVNGIYVYECKTCSRTFPSFQALGGHRASHKKPKVNVINVIDQTRKPPPYAAVSDEDEPSPQLFQSRKNNSSSSSSLSLQLSHRIPANMKKSSNSKLHDCSICGAEFNSGQALGGHMRRHRGSTTTTTTISSAVATTNTTLSLIPYSPVTTTMSPENQENQKSMNDGLCLDLDLNLPAPAEIGNQDQHRESSFKFTGNQNNQQQTVHLSATPTLVDCHY